jgi:hypothetical protein
MQTAAHSTHSYIQLHTLQGNTRQATINTSTEQRDKENAFLLCRGHFNQNTVFPTGKLSLNTAYQTEHIAIKLQNTRYITQIVNSLKTF